MEGRLVEYYMETLRELDPDELVCDLRIESDELLDAFRQRAIMFIREEWGDADDDS